MWYKNIWICIIIIIIFYINEDVVSMNVCHSKGCRDVLNTSILREFIPWGHPSVIQLWLRYHWHVNEFKCICKLLYLCWISKFLVVCVLICNIMIVFVWLTRMRVSTGVILNTTKLTLIFSCTATVNDNAATDVGSDFENGTCCVRAISYILACSQCRDFHMKQGYA